jgi:hypothetical protein
MQNWYFPPMRGLIVKIDILITSITVFPAHARVDETSNSTLGNYQCISRRFMFLQIPLEKHRPLNNQCISNPYRVSSFLAVTPFRLNTLRPNKILRKE